MHLAPGEADRLDRGAVENGGEFRRGTHLADLGLFDGRGFRRWGFRRRRHELIAPHDLCLLSLFGGQEVLGTLSRQPVGVDLLDDNLLALLTRCLERIVALLGLRKAFHLFAVANKFDVGVR